MLVGLFSLSGRGRVTVAVEDASKACVWLAGWSPTLTPARSLRGRGGRAFIALLLAGVLLLPACGRRYPESDPAQPHIAEMRRAINNGDTDAALGAIDRAIEARGGEDAALTLVKARLLFDAARFRDAVAAAETAGERADAMRDRAQADLAAARKLDDAERDDAIAAARDAAHAARGYHAQARFVRAVALRSTGRNDDADAALERALAAFDDLVQQPPGESEAERAQATLSAMLHKAAILRLQGHTESAVFQVQQTAAKFPDWRGGDAWTELLSREDAERRLYDVMVADVMGE